MGGGAVGSAPKKSTVGPAGCESLMLVSSSSVGGDTSLDCTSVGGDTSLGCTCSTGAQLSAGLSSVVTGL